AVARGEQELGGADQLFVIEMLLLGRVWLRFRHRARWRVFAELVRGELAVEGGHMLRAGAVPFGGGSGVARCFGGAAAPISRSRHQADGRIGLSACASNSCAAASYWFFLRRQRASSKATPGSERH